MKKTLLCLCLLLTLVAFATGCGKEKRCALSGAVTSNGQPVPEGVVNFIPENPDPSKGVVAGSCAITNGTYAMGPKDAQLLPGKYKVVVNASSTILKSTGEVIDPYDVKDGKVAPEAVDFVDLVPPKFGKESELYVEVGNQSKMTFDINMVSE
ncbi:MAG: hypothetical protein IJM30_07255 [Thermoguttaceae bacterium]|nr:hypothetical protein [Thermoguttaceae bacterium]